MLVLSAGDSFVWGSEMADELPTKFSLSTWPALWALKNNFEYYSVALPGSANNSITRRVIDYCENVKKPDVVIVQWTYPGRREMRFRSHFTDTTNNSRTNYYSFTPWSEIKSWEEIYNNPDKYPFDRHASNISNFETSIRNQIKELENTGVADTAHLWFKYIANNDSDKYYFYSEVSHLKNYLENNNIKYIFSMAETSIMSAVTSNDSSVNALMSISSTCPWVLFDNMGLVEWAQKNNKPIGITHPLEQAHKDALVLIEEKLNEYLL